MAEIKMKYGNTSEVLSNSYNELDLVFDIEKNIMYIYETAELNQVGTKVLYSNSLASITSPTDGTVALISDTNGSATGIYYRLSGQWLTVSELAGNSTNGFMQYSHYNAITSLSNVLNNSIIKKTGTYTYDAATISDFADVSVNGYSIGTLQSVLDQIGAKTLSIEKQTTKNISSVTIPNTGWTSTSPAGAYQYVLTSPTLFIPNWKPHIGFETLNMNELTEGSQISIINNEDGTATLLCQIIPIENFIINITMEYVITTTL